MKLLLLLIAFLMLDQCFAQNVGIGTPAPKARLHVTDSSVIFSAAGLANPAPGNVPVSGFGRRMMWYADKAAFRAGFVSGDEWDAARIGNYSFASGYGSEAVGQFGVSMGLNNKANASNSIAIGTNAVSTADHAISLGTVAFATNNGALALGYQSTAQGKQSVAMGYNIISKSWGGTVVGMLNDASDSPNPDDTSSSDRMFQVGIGYYDANIDDEVRKNAMTILRSGSMGIGTVLPASSALVDISSTTKGFLPPRMTAAQRNAIASPAEGLMVYQTDQATGYYYVRNGAWTGLQPSPVYETVSICSQQWMQQNLDVTTYRNGDPIPNISDPAQWASLTTGAYCYYWNNPGLFGPPAGKLYNWYAINDPRGLAPAGWHIPTNTEWGALITCLGGTSVAGNALKTFGYYQWGNYNGASTNSSGFAAVPGSSRLVNGSFNTFMLLAYYWTSNMLPGGSVVVFSLNDGSGSVSGFTTTDFKAGYSVRCVKD